MDFEISVVRNSTSYKNAGDKLNFILDKAYDQNLQFVDGSTFRSMSTVLGDLEGVCVFRKACVGCWVREKFESPNGLTLGDFNCIASRFL